jgi:hypothetical protein
VFSDRKGNLIRTVLGPFELLFEITHIVPSKYKAATDSRVTNVPFHSNLAIKVRKMSETPFTSLLDIGQRRKYQVRNTKGLANIGNVLALGIFDIRIQDFPVICDQENNVGALDGCSQRID